MSLLEKILLLLTKIMIPIADTTPGEEHTPPANEKGSVAVSSHAPTRIIQCDEPLTVIWNNSDLRQIIQFDSGIALFVGGNSVTTIEQSGV